MFLLGLDLPSDCSRFLFWLLFILANLHFFKPTFDGICFWLFSFLAEYCVISSSNQHLCANIWLSCVFTSCFFINHTSLLRSSDDIIMLIWEHVELIQAHFQQLKIFALPGNKIGYYKLLLLRGRKVNTHWNFMCPLNIWQPTHSQALLHHSVAPKLGGIEMAPTWRLLGRRLLSAFDLPAPERVGNLVDVARKQLGQGAKDTRTKTNKCSRSSRTGKDAERRRQQLSARAAKGIMKAELDSRIWTKVGS